MKFYSTTGSGTLASLKEAVLQGVPPDGGLYLPVTVPHVAPTTIEHYTYLNPIELYTKLAYQFFEEDLTQDIVTAIVKAAFNYPIAFVPFSDRHFGLELFHGPTLSFKDFGARFMAQLMPYLLNKDEELIVLVATSGDTGSAVANAFYNMANVKVFILYASGQVSPIQKQQLTTFGGNVTAIEIAGSYDDCQKLINLALKDEKLKKRYAVTTANSINIVRLIPQAFYFFYAYSQLPNKNLPLAVSIPSGNCGHLMSAVIAKKMGLPIKHFVVATNINDEVPHYLQTGKFEPHPSFHTISNSMDVGNPSNFPRLCDFFHHELGEIRRKMEGIAFTDEATKKAIKEVYQKQGYVLEPHSAISYLGLNHFLNHNPDWAGIFLATAHPAKFPEVVEEIIGKKIAIPPELLQLLNKPSQSIKLSKDYVDLQKTLMKHSL